MPRRAPPIVAVALNPALDRTLEVPDLALGRHARGRLMSVHPAGKAVNVARVLGMLGTRCLLTGFVGEDDGDRFKRSFEKTPVRVDLFGLPGPTRENVTLVDPKRREETHVRDAGSAVAAEDLARLRKKLAILAVPGAYVVFAGSLPPGMEAAPFADLLAVCAEKGARVAVDSSGPGLEAVRRAARLWLVKPNREELAELAGRPVGGDEDLRATARGLLAQIDEVIVTAGAEGACLVTPHGTWRARPHVDPRAVLNTVGSGDALLAGFLHAHAAGKPPPDCLRWGVACGAASTLQLRAGVVNPYDVKACLEKVDVAAVKPKDA